jgi:deazaflavin-dependent oxidoreductase (nitroreductase family)
MAHRLPPRVNLAIGWIGRSRFVRRAHPALYRRFHGAAFLGRSMGCLTILLHTTGAKSNRPRTAPLYAFPAGDGPGAARAGGPRRLAVVASNGGHGNPPAWYRNLREHPGAVVEEGSRRWAARARVTAGEERERLWRAITAVYPGYDDYQAVTAAQIPVVVLEPIAEP